MKKVFIYLFILIFAISYAIADPRTGNQPAMYFCQGLTGGTATAAHKDLDAFDISASGSPNAYNLIDNDGALVRVISGTTVNKYEYIYDADSTETELSPHVIYPEDRSSAGAWILVGWDPDIPISYDATASETLPIYVNQKRVVQNTGATGTLEIKSRPLLLGMMVQI